MRRKHVITTVILVAIFAGLVLLQVHTWRNFDWHQFATDSAQVFTTAHGLLLVGLALSCIYGAYYLRALRWSLFLKPTKPVSTWRLIAPQVMGFTGLALFGRPGELIRPYLVAKREDLSFASQLAVWSVERICDIGAFAIILCVTALFPPPSLRANPFFPSIRKGAFVIFVIVLLMSAVAVLVRRAGPRVSELLRRAFARAPRLGEGIARKITGFSEGLNTIQDLPTFAEILAVSIIMWLMIAAAYIFTMHAFPAPLRNMSLGDVMLVMGSSMVGSMLQLPAVGGGSQLATINMMHYVLHVPKDLAVACGILLWLISFMVIIPVGLVLAHFNRISLFSIEAETESAEPQAGRADSSKQSA